MRSRPPEALLFDLGGVLIDVDFARVLKAWAPSSALSAAELQRAFAADDPYARHERGEISKHDYFAHIAATLRLSADPEEIEAGWNAIFAGEIAETRALVEKARETVPCHAFSNTNASHMERWTALYPQVVRAFDRIFVSHRIGLRKPERAAFEHICTELALDPQSIVFFDDSAQNVAGARDAGLRAVLVRTPKDVADALRDVGVV